MSTTFSEQTHPPSRPRPRRTGRLFAAIALFLVSFGSVSADERAFVEALKKRAKDSLTQAEYRAGMEQKKLAIADPETALRDPVWHPCAAVALGNGYSVMMQFRPAHPMVAEYHRRIMVFGGTERRASLIGSLQLKMNFGGRTHMLIYRHLDAKGKVSHVTFEAREGGKQTVRLQEPDFEDPPRNTRQEYVGLISGTAYPLKFCPPLIVSEATARTKLR